MTELDVFLRDAAALAGMDSQHLLARVFHIDDGALADVIAPMDDATRELVVRLDRELRIRNPGLHYVVRKMFLGYRREGATPASMGERSQIFASIMRINTRLVVVLPVNADSVALMANARDLRGNGHHGIGDVGVSVTNAAELEHLLRDFDYWLKPSI